MLTLSDLAAPSGSGVCLFFASSFFSFVGTLLASSWQMNDRTWNLLARHVLTTRCFERQSQNLSAKMTLEPNFPAVRPGREVPHPNLLKRAKGTREEKKERAHQGGEDVRGKSKTHRCTHRCTQKCITHTLGDSLPLFSCPRHLCVTRSHCDERRKVVYLLRELFYLRIAANGTIYIEPRQLQMAKCAVSTRCRRSICAPRCPRKNEPDTKVRERRNKNILSDDGICNYKHGVRMQSE